MNKTSVITVCLNSEKTIEKTIQSVIHQQGAEIEYIVIDGGSSDGTVDIIKKYDQSITYWISEADNGIYAAMNKGLSRATGDVIGFINSGDCYVQDAIKISLKFMESSAAQIVSGGLYYCDDQGTIMNKATYPSRNPWEGMAWGHPSVFARKEVFDIIGTFDETYRISADYKWLLSCYSSGIRFAYMDEASACFTLGGVSVTNVYQKAIEDYRAKREVLQTSSLNKKEKQILLEAAKNEMYLAVGKYYGEKEDFEDQLIALIPKRENGLYLYGYGKWGKKAESCMKKHGVRILGISDRLGNTESGIERESLAELLERTEKTVLVCISRVDDQIIDQMKKYNASNAVLFKELYRELGKRILNKHDSCTVDL